MPVLVMLASFPLALVDATLALLSWLLLIPFGLWVRRRVPAGLPASWRGDE
jgi:hypothetical protein